MFVRNPHQVDEHPAPRSTVENRVWQAVLICAVMDLHGVAVDGDRERARRDAERFFANDELLRLVCEAANVDGCWFRRKLRDPALRDRLLARYVTRKTATVRRPQKLLTPEERGWAVSNGWWSLSDEERLERCEQMKGPRTDEPERTISVQES